MKTSRLNYLALAILALTVALCFTGCFGLTSTAANQPLLIQPVLDRIVPADFEGDGEFGEHGQYLDLEIRVGGLHRTAAGWSWKWLAYRRSVSIPLAPGVPYRQNGWVTLGTPTQNP